VLLDGTGLLYRSFFAIAELSTRDGRPTNAVFGFIRALRQLQHTWRPTHWGVVLDGGMPQARVALLPEYKAQRPPMPEKLRAQFPPIREYLERAGIPCWRVEGEEADDVIASLTARAGEAEETVIVSSDKDLLQLITDRVTMVSSGKLDTRTGPQDVVARTGVRPDQIVDWLALTGDDVDNIPGVPGVGPKTAAKLLQTFGSVEALWPRLEEVEPVRIREVLRAHRAEVGRNQALVALRRDVPCPLDWEQCAVRPEEASRLLPFFERMEFHSLARPLEQGSLF
jgi:DNA polymerase-1